MTLSGRCTYRHKLDGVATSIQFLDSSSSRNSLKGITTNSMYSICFTDQVVVHDADTESLVNVLKHDSRVNDTTVHSGLLVSGTDAGTLCGWDMRMPINATQENHGNVFTLKDAHEGSRIKGVVSMPISCMIGSGSSDGLIRLWDVRKMNRTNTGAGYKVSIPKDKSFVDEANCDGRISCLAVGASIRPKNGLDTENDVIDATYKKDTTTATKASIKEGQEKNSDNFCSNRDAKQHASTRDEGESDDTEEMQLLSRVYHKIRKRERKMRQIRLRSVLMSAVSTKIDSVWPP